MTDSGSMLQLVRRRARWLSTGALALVAALAILLVLPIASFGTKRPNATVPGVVAGALNLVGKVTGAVSVTAQHVLSPSHAPTAGSSAAAPPAVAARPARAGAAARATTTGVSVPPMYGTNPAGQGTVASLFLPPSATVPYPYAPGGAKGSGEILTVGRGRSEQQSNGTYDAHTTIAALLGTEILGVNATQGQSNTGPLNAIQTGLLDQLCKSTSQAVCLTVLAADTAATTSGATTHFAVASVGVLGATGLQTKIATADSSIQTTGSCQTASGSSQAANIALAGGQVASVGKSSESSTACAGKTPTQTASSSVIGLGGTGVGLPAAGCANGTPNTQAGLLPPVISILCNADSTTQLATPAGVREALTVIALQVANSALLKTTVVAAQSHAVAPNVTPTPPGKKKGGGGGKKKKKGGGGKKKKVSGGHKQRCTDSDHDCGVGPPGTGKCTNDTSDGDGDCVLPGGGAETQCTDSDHDCGVGPPGTGKCTNDISDGDGDCVLPGGGPETGGPTATVKSANLPFTGENVLEVILVGLVLAGGGLALSTRARKRT